MLWLILLCTGGAVAALSLALLEPLRRVRAERRDSRCRAGEGLRRDGLRRDGLRRDGLRRDGPLGEALLWALISSVAGLRQGRQSRYQSRLAQSLRHAGYPCGVRSAAEFIAVLKLSGFVVGAGVLALLLLLGRLSPGTLMFAVILSALTVALLHIWLKSLIERRRRQLSRQYPYFLDLAVMSMEAGAGFADVIEVYSQDGQNLELAGELRWVLKDMQMGSTLREALLSLSQRLPCEEIRQSLNAVIQGQRMGTPLGQLLRDQAGTIRFRRSQLAERAAEEIKVRITGPVILMMLSVFILILGPAVINVIDSGIF